MKRAIAKVFTSGRSQAVRIPKQFRFNCNEVLIEREGDHIVLTPRPRSWKEFFASQVPVDLEAPEDASPEEVDPLQ
jgi:antitoxin VapB